MLFNHQRITIISVRKPKFKNINQDLQYFGTSLGLFNLRDRDKSCFRIFIELLKSAKSKRPVSSDELAYKLDLSRGTVIHHIDKLMEAGIVINEGRKYMLRVENLKDLIEEIEKDLMRTCETLKKTATEIDESLGL